MSTATAASSSSLILPSLSAKAVTFSKPTSISFSSFKFAASFSLSLTPLQHLHQSSPVSHRFARNVAVTSEFGQEEEVFSSDGEEEPPSFTADLKVFVGNLPFNVESAQLADLFSSYGSVEVAEVIYDKLTGRSRGFGFVTMSTSEEAERAAQQLNGSELEGRPLRVNAGPPPEKGTTFPREPRAGGSFDSANRLYVGNLSWSVDNVALESFFSDHGKVLDAKVVYDRESGRSRGFGFVTYSSSEEVEGAIESLDGSELDGRAIRVSVAESRPRREF